MKKITLILITLFAFIYANAQDYTVPRGLPYHDTRWIENKGVAGATYLFDSIVMFKNIADTQMKPLYPAMGYIQNFGGDSTFWIWDMVRWKKLAGGAAVNDRFGLEDATFISNRYINGQSLNMEMDSLGQLEYIVGNSVANSYSEGTTFGLYNHEFDLYTKQGVNGSSIAALTQYVQLHSFTDTTNNFISVGDDDVTIQTVNTSTPGSVAGITLTDSVITFNETLLKNYFFPTYPGLNNNIIPLTVNGVAANAVTGNITIPIGGTGTVTSFSAGNLSPLFTSSVATSTTTPALTFALTNAAAGTVFGNATASAAAPSYTTHPIIGVASGSTGILGISGTTSGTVSLSAADAAGTWTMKLPTTGGTNLYFLQTDGSGNTTWAAPFTLTTTGTSGAATFSGGTLNIPQYSGGVSLSAIGSSPNANAATLTGTVLNLEPANASFGGVVTTATQTFAGDKTLTGNTFLTGTVQTNATSLSGNFYIPSASSTANTTDARYTVPTTSVGTDFRITLGGGITNPTLTTNATYAAVIIPSTNITEASSGTHNQIDQMYINGFTVTNAGASVTRTAVLHLAASTGATGASNFGIYNANGSNVLASTLSTTANTVTSIVTTSTGASTFGSGGANVNLAATQTASQTSNIVLNVNAATTVSGTSGTGTTVGINSNVATAGNAVGTSYMGFRADIQNNGTGTVTNTIGYDAFGYLGSGSAGAVAGTVTNYFGFKNENFSRDDSSKYTNYYSYYADSVVKFWGVTNPVYGYYQVGTYMLNFFAGNTIHGYNGGVNTGSQLQTTSFSVGYKATALDYTATTTDNTIEVTATAKTVTLPTAVGCQGRIYRVKLTASGSGTVATTSSQNIDGSTTYSLSAQYKYVEVVSNNVGWIVVANN